MGNLQQNRASTPIPVSNEGSRALQISQIGQPASQRQRDNTEIIEEQNTFYDLHLTIKFVVNSTSDISKLPELNARASNNL
jgi:hypothetical protein